MAYTDSLFQLGMDLTRSSTAQKEDHVQSAQLAHEGKKTQVPRDEPRPRGSHLIIDLFGAERLDDLQHIEETLKRCVALAGGRLLHIHLNRFMPDGSVFGVAVLAEGHISLHTWPKTRTASLNVAIGADATPRAAIGAVREAFSPAKAVVRLAKKPAIREKAQQAA